MVLTSELLSSKCPACRPLLPMAPVLVPIRRSVPTFAESEYVPLCAPCFNPVADEKVASGEKVLKATSILRPSAARKVMPPASPPVSEATTPVLPEILFMA